jgi:thiamine biosynthesis lipoprotein
MATHFAFKVSCAAAHSSLADEALSAAHEKVAQLERELSEFIEASPVYQLNHAKPGQKIRFNPSALTLLKESERIRSLSDSAFNCCAKSQGTSAQLLGYDFTRGEVWKIERGAWLSFGAIGKGYALDQAADLIERAGFHDYVLSAGGSSLIFSGFAVPQDPQAPQALPIPWSWGWSWKKNENGENVGIPLSHLSGNRVALGISGTHEKGNHIVYNQGHRGNSGRAAFRSALVSHHRATDADALSTALFVAGWEKSLPFLKQADARATAVIDADEVPRWNSGFQALFGALTTIALCVGLEGLFHAQNAWADESVDLGELGSNAFTPYLTERHAIWMLLPIFALVLVISHLLVNNLSGKNNKELKRIPNETPKRS